MSITRICSSGAKYVAPVDVSTSTPKNSVRPPCAGSPADWDLDAGGPEAWRSAVRVCASCPLADRCAQLAQTFIDRGDTPRAMIWAGVAYDNSGRVIENLDAHRPALIDHKRPVRIIRTGRRPRDAAPALPAPRRHFVLGRPLAPTGTDGL